MQWVKEGDLGHQGILQMDITRWFLSEEELSPRVWSVGGRLGYDYDGETTNSPTVYHDYANRPGGTQKEETRENSSWQSRSGR